MIVSRETSALLSRFVDLLQTESARQNLIAKSTLPHVWERHIADSLQLVSHAGDGIWLDIGTGAGFPGLVVACTRSEPVILVEPRQLRADFLRRVVDDLGLSHVIIEARAIEAVPPAAAGIISARAVASLDKLLAMGLPHASTGTRWLLPKGRTAAAELATARQTWQGDFRLIPSQTDPEASIIMAENVRRRERSRRPR